MNKKVISSKTELEVMAKLRKSMEDSVRNGKHQLEKLERSICDIELCNDLKAKNPAICIVVKENCTEDDSLDGHKNRYKSMCDHYGWGAPRFYVKDGRNRFDVKTLMDDINQGKVDLVYVESLNSISRDRFVVRNLVCLMRRHNVGLIINKKRIDINS